MAVRHGYGKVAGADALLFAYDTGDTQNCYKGEPATNLITSGLPGYFGSGGETLYKREMYGKVSDSGVFQRNFINNPATSDTSTFNNNGGFYKNFTTSNLASTTRYVQISFDFYMITRYRTFSSSTRGLNGYLGVTNTDDSTDIYFWDTRYSNGSGDDWSNQSIYEGKWQKVSLIAALRNDKTPESINAMYIYYDRFTQGEGIITNFMITETDTLPTGPVRYAEGTRSDTQGLLDLTGKTTANIGSVSFNSNSQITYESGSSDRVSITDPGYPSSATDAFTLEVIFKIPTGADWNNGLSTGIIGRGGYAGSLGITRSTTGNEVIFWARVNGGTTYDPRVSNLARDVYHHIIGTYDGAGLAKIYHNGEYVAQESGNTTGTFDAGVYNIGGGNSFSGAFGGYGEADDIPIFKLYNRDLTAGEVLNNYNNYKKRFNI